MASANDNYFRAFSSLGCAELELDEVLSIASRHHIEAVELRALADSIDLIAYFEQKFETEVSGQNQFSGRDWKSGIYEFQH